MKTIRQIADEIGVSKQAVFKKIKREPLSTSLQGLTTTVDGRLMVEVDGEKLIKQAFSEITSSTTDNQLTGAVDGLVDGASTKNEEKTVAVDGVISVLQATIDTLQGLPGLLTHWPPLSRQQQRPRLFTRELLNNSYLMGAALSRRNERKVGLVDCLGKMNDMPGGMCSW